MSACLFQGVRFIPCLKSRRVLYPLIPRTKTVSWFSELPELFGTTKEGTNLDKISGYAIEQIQHKLSNLGGAGKRFETEMTEIQKLIDNNDPPKFENGLTELGELLGFSTEHPKGKAPPDSVWKLADTIVLLFEAKSNKEKEGRVSIDTCREAKGHYDWAEQHITSFHDVQKKFCIIIDQRTKLDKDAVPKYAEGLYYIHIDRIREIFKTIDGVLTRIRNQYTKYDEEEIRLKIYDELKQYKLDPESLIAEIENKPLSSLPLQ